MKTYYTKCGRKFSKSANADTTGYHFEERGDRSLKNLECGSCPFVVDVKDGWPVRVHKRFECRAGGKPPNHNNSYRGSAKDKCTLQIDSLDHDFCEAVIAFARSHPELSASYNADHLSDCRRTVSVSCSQNKKGMAAKAELIEKFFPSIPANQDSDDAPHAEAERKKFKPKCPSLRVIGDKYVQCGTHDAKILGKLEFGTQRECLAKTDQQCFDRFLDCEAYRRYYADPSSFSGPAFGPSSTIDFHTCVWCCNNSGYTDLPDGYDGQKYCFCQLRREPMEKEAPACEWFNRHPDWVLEQRSGPEELPALHPALNEESEDNMDHTSVTAETEQSESTPTQESEALLHHVEIMHSDNTAFSSSALLIHAFPVPRTSIRRVVSLNPSRLYHEQNACHRDRQLDHDG